MQNDKIPTCQCGREIKPYFEKAYCPGVGWLISAKPVFLGACNACIMAPYLRKRA